MNKVTPLSPPQISVKVNPATAKLSPAAPANEGKPSPERLRELFHQELLEFGPALLMCDNRGQISWSNAAFRRIAETRVDGGTVAERLRLGEVAEEMDFRRTTVFRDWDFAAAGGVQRLRARFAPLHEPGGQWTGFGGMLTLQRDGGQIDADEAQNALERQTDFIRLSSDWMWEADAKLNLRLVTHRVVGALGMVPQQMVGMNLLDLVATPTLRENLQRRLDKMSPFRDLPVDATDAAGKRKLFLISAVPVFDHLTGALSGYRGSASDITELTRREENLRAAKEAAETAARAKTQFLANMSHELMTPLNAIIGFADVMRMGLLGNVENAEYRAYIRDIHASAVGLMGTITDILDVSRIETGDAELNESACHIEDLFDSVARLIQQRLQTQGLSLSLDLPARLPRVNADKRKLKQILANLLANAVKFTPQGGRIILGAGLNDGGDLELSVSDTGIGIAPADIERVMQPFAQVDGGLNRKYEGTGLGLTLSQGLARLHGGELRLESRVGEGTRAIVTLPASRLIDGSHLTPVK
ncbi:PAS domain S-box-containing protein [Dongia mobilis]|uniref:histidine kinase n=1 Tax=Dongia mobilis TaxID=578943 RepID=A0A4R6WRC1_9PROT|nr:ATP-binding protein [Dongia mobilis]TDQ84046.1 PAS domain S-box-containing protein [Dongia mobilis]